MCERSQRSLIIPTAKLPLADQNTGLLKTLWVVFHCVLRMLDHFHFYILTSYNNNNTTFNTPHKRGGLKGLQSWRRLEWACFCKTLSYINHKERKITCNVYKLVIRKGAEKERQGRKDSFVSVEPFFKHTLNTCPSMIVFVFIYFLINEDRWGTRRDEVEDDDEEDEGECDA